MSGGKTAHSFIRQDSEEYYFLSDGQYSLFPFSRYESVLNEEGKELLDRVRRMVKEMSFKNEIHPYSRISEHSGGWRSDQLSPHYGKPHPNTVPNDNIQGIWNTWNNVCIQGVASDNKPITTSACIFIFEDEGWCYTASGSLYKLTK